METVIIVIHLMAVVALVGVVLLQRSEGGALGMGGGGGGFMTVRGSGNVLTRSTAILAAVFFVTSLSLTLLARYSGGPSSILDTGPSAGNSAVNGNNLSVNDLINSLQPPGGAGVPGAPPAGAAGSGAPPAVPSTP